MLLRVLVDVAKSRHHGIKIESRRESWTFFDEWYLGLPGSFTPIIKVEGRN